MNRHEKALEILHNGTVIPATVLALDENRHFNERRQRALMRYYLDAGVGGIATAVHSTQFAIRDPAVGLFEPVLKTVADEINKFENRSGKVIVRVAGACGKAEQAVAEAALAAQYGYDAVLLSPGGLNELSEDELVERTRAVAQVLPVIGFNLQTAVGGRRFSYNYWKNICAVEGIVAIKAASFNRYQTLDLVRAAAESPRSDKISLYTGNDDNFVVDLLTDYVFTENGKTYEKRFIGGLLGHWTVWTKKAVELYGRIREAVADNRVTSELLAMAAHQTDINGAFFDAAHDFKGCIAGLHEVLRRQGLMEGIWCLDPDETLSPGQKEEIDRVYKMYPQMNDDGFIRQNLSRWLSE